MDDYIQQNVTLNGFVTPEDIHELGLSECKRIKKEIDNIKSMGDLKIISYKLEEYDETFKDLKDLEKDRENFYKTDKSNYLNENNKYGHGYSEFYEKHLNIYNKNI